MSTSILFIKNEDHAQHVQNRALAALNLHSKLHYFAELRKFGLIFKNLKKKQVRKINAMRQEQVTRPPAALVIYK